MGARLPHIGLREPHAGDQRFRLDVSWEAASQLTGIPVPTIEHAVRVGRITRRPRHGTQPTLDDRSVLEWAEWYREVGDQFEQWREERRLKLERRRVAREQRGLERGRRGPAASSLDVGPEPPEPHGWLETKQAAEILGVTPATVHRHAGSAGDTPRRAAVGHRGVGPGLHEKRRRWMSWQEAADLIGCSRHAVAKLLAAVHLHQRQVNDAASLSRAPVEAAARVYLLDDRIER